MIHALRYTEDLERAGFSPEQAKASVKIWMDLMSDSFATKSDFRELQFIYRDDLKDFQIDIGQRFQLVDQRFNEVDQRFLEIENKFEKRFNEAENKIDRLESRLTIKLGGLMAIGLGLISTILTLKS
jgi:DNA repair exonuclease SbcCD ATPase subunit